MGVSENYFMEIAKFRAARLLWAQIVKQYEPQCDCACQMHVCAITSEYNQTLFDSYVNLLRSQTETMSAAIANVDSIVVTPFDKPYETPDDFSERLARNQQLLLKEEAHFDKLVDVSGGSYYIEAGTVYQDPNTGLYYIVREVDDESDSLLAPTGEGSGAASTGGEASSSGSSGVTDDDIRNSRAMGAD